MNDIQINSGFDLDIQNGDFVVSESTEQHIRLIVLSEKGDWRQSPFLGVGVRDMLKDEAIETELRQEIQKQTELDGLKNVSIKISPLEVSGNY